ncbi:aldolase/citrate lyase family protein [Pectobacterium parmentieri]|uniref:HpcH/HpaI aldolase/citrate lyase domain-containing protein n=1 Tax=Pectobacterium parmentieri TaxID=1905730 RepID=A0A8B3FJ03_PECPM|nr:aldolase/citrate lyase family protein [Pectobacterium parmentieri]AOR61352.1 hypothetical protein A8F97_21080 [Pectobacterium parmentieri]AYH11987.1 hypothetical protein C5E24_20960 [Pectobacterium parmentieri]AYH17299.1 hypothetical protein C5E22_01780 [Pectobacterium parmentieri]AYH38264.1 hypothetical protein C5E17_20685 [Pectobacterium parmentieri]AZS58491.1 hypothetical protein C5E18_21370 [Pectobacterium parmentieri]
MEHAKRYLLVPGNTPRRFQHAVNYGADTVIFDSEDAVNPDDKNQARENIIQWYENDTAVSEINCKKPIQLNKFGSIAFNADIDRLNKPNKKVGLKSDETSQNKAVKWETVLPKIASAEMRHEAEKMRNRNKLENVNIIAIIKTARGAMPCGRPDSGYGRKM